MDNAYLFYCGPGETTTLHVFQKSFEEDGSLGKDELENHCGFAKCLRVTPKRKESVETTVEMFGSVLCTVIYEAGYVGLTSCQAWKKSAELSAMGKPGLSL